MTEETETAPASIKKWVIPAVFFLTVVTALVYFLVLKKEKNTLPPPVKGEISILWAEWPPADNLQKLSQDFTRETGIKVNVIQEPWGAWQDIFFNEMEKKGQAYDMVIGDSQWLGRGATGGHYIELTNWLESHGVHDSMTPASITGYSEYPKGSGHYWTVPVEGDAMGFAYRKDLFEDPDEKTAFKKKYGYELTVPETWFQLRDIAEFFFRPDKDFFGVLVWAEPRYDGITMGIQALLWAWGADLGDSKTHRVSRKLNTPAGIEALEFYKSLHQFNNPRWVHNYLDTTSNSNQPMMEGKVAMCMGYFAIAPDLLDPAKNPYANVTGFFANPRGPQARVSSLGGQGISVVSYGKKKGFCFKFLEWLVGDPVQEKWAELGGLSCNKKVLASEKFLKASPINRPFKESIEMVRDFWAVPEYPELLKISQKYFYEYVTTEKYTAREVMDIIAREWENIFEYAGYYKE